MEKITIETAESEVLSKTLTQNSEKTGKTLMVRNVNIESNTEFLSLKTIETVLQSYKQIDKYAYVLHDKDVSKTGELKKAHWHVVLKLKNPVPHNYIANWFGLAPNFVDVPKGRDSFIQCCEYLTHESQKQQELGKFLYPDNEVFSNFNFREELDEYNETKLLKNVGNNKKLELRKKVMIKGLSLFDLRKKNEDDYIADYKALNDCRREYIKNYSELPKSRINFYITGGSGTGKSLSSRALAKTLIDPTNKMDDREVFFTTGQSGSLFQGYDGQPVIIWDDLRAFDLLNNFNKNVGAIFNLFDVIPSSSEQNIKFSSVKLINSINIVNSIEPFKKFCDTICYKNGLSEMVEHDKQIYRRFPFFIELSASQKYDFFVNSQFFDENEPNYKAYMQHKNMGIGLLKITNAYKNDENKRVELTNKHFETVEKAHKKAVSKFEDNGENIEELQQSLQLEILEMENKPIETSMHLMDATTYRNDEDNKEVRNLKKW